MGGRGRITTILAWLQRGEKRQGAGGKPIHQAPWLLPERLVGFWTATGTPALFHSVNFFQTRRVD